ncbi:DUF3276 family protein [Aridibaculum aurantiacum]|uniref:DUF3276 family protein n=1 Tax=Aridibaculum aurantiacum TaxID=2810307 RepID=UPI001A96B9BF
MAYDNNEQKIESVYSKRIRAGKRRTYFFDVRATRSNDYFLTITESRKRFNDNGYDRHKIFLYKEDFNKFIKALNEAVDYVKTDLMPDFDFDAFNHDYDENGNGYAEGTNGYHESVAEVAAEVEEVVETIAVSSHSAAVAEVPVSEPVNLSSEEVDKW